MTAADATPRPARTILTFKLGEAEALGISLGFPANASGRHPFGKIVKAIGQTAIASGQLSVGDIVHSINGTSLRERDAAALIAEGRSHGSVTLDVTRHAGASWLDTTDEAAMAAAYREQCAADVAADDAAESKGRSLAAAIERVVRLPLWLFV